ncbi:MAG: cysteine dioxygenase family protein [Deltaproteobacteria bacterium]|nr:cysteine dioxygenase family protein [Deltaproteobacteria bacterium]
MLSELMSQKEWFGDILGKVLFNREFSESQKAGIWPNEFTLHRSPDRAFLVLCYIWGPYLSDTAHDHGSWGIIGSFMKPIGERKYMRLDDGKKEGYAELKEVSSTVLQPGEITSVLPLNKGIHRMENRSDDVAITINVYGRSMRRGYIQFFYPENRAVTRVYPPKSLREALAIRAAGALSASWSEDLLKQVLSSELTDPIRKEGEYSLARLKSSL